MCVYVRVHTYICIVYEWCDGGVCVYGRGYGWLFSRCKSVCVLGEGGQLRVCVCMCVCVRACACMCGGGVVVVWWWWWCVYVSVFLCVYV